MDVFFRLDYRRTFAYPLGFVFLPNNESTESAAKGKMKGHGQQGNIQFIATQEAHAELGLKNSYDKHNAKNKGGNSRSQTDNQCNTTHNFDNGHNGRHECGDSQTGEKALDVADAALEFIQTVSQKMTPRITRIMKVLIEE